MRTIEASAITAAIARLSIQANYYLGEDVYAALQRGEAEEKSPLGKEVIAQILANADIARQEDRAICQDTGIAIVFMDIGQDVHIVGGRLADAVNEGVAQGYSVGYLRKSVVAEPLFNRKNTADNTPAVLYTSIVPGDKVKIKLAPKGAGSENKSEVKMLVPADGVEGVKKAVLDIVLRAGENPCPPIIVGVGIGGTMDKAAVLSKKALLRPITQANPHPDYAKLEKDLLALINKTGIGPQLGGTVTALGVNIEWYPTHIAMLPLAVTISCHATRHAETEL